MSQLSEFDSGKKYCVISLGINGTEREPDTIYDYIIYELNDNNANMIHSLLDDDYGFIYNVTYFGKEANNNTIVSTKNIQ